jgi:NAD(P)-dependent dehydrogenase (short-subunit alcohol dehydrogenase family)
VATALVGGGTGGLGGAVTQALLDAGWRCVVPYRVAEEAEHQREAPAAQAAGERLALVQADLFEPSSVAHVVEVAQAEPQAPLGAVVNLVGGFDAGARVHETPIERFEAQFRVNLRPAYLLCAAALPGLLARGDGAIVCVSSRAALRPFAGAAGYIASKAAVLAFVDALAVEYTKDGIRSNAILPSVIDTPANRAAQPDADYAHWVSPDDIATVIAFLCSPGAAAISGAHVPVYGQA